jgi:predicted SAM-dependent methyltransferase
MLLRSIPQPIKRTARIVAFYGNKRYCPVCNHSFRTFMSAGNPAREEARCPACDALERHRFLWRYLQEKTPFFESRGARMLHVAAEECFEPRWRHIIGRGYITADLMHPADVKMDVTDIQFSDNEFDIVYCSHVLEHVPDDRKAMREFHRVLKPGGFALLLVPITEEKTFEDPSITDPKERLRLFGQHDHVRRYGPDYVGRLRDAGFVVNVMHASDFLSPKEIERLAIGTSDAGEIFHCRKSLE